MNTFTHLKGVCIGIVTFISMMLGGTKEWIFLLFIAVVLDYITGIIAAAIKGKLSSQTGWKGILKKLSYFAVVSATIIIDWVLLFGGEKIGMTLHTGGLITIMSIVWLLLDELISILENLGEIGVPLPGILKKMLFVLQKKVSSQIQIEYEAKECEEKETDENK